MFTGESSTKNKLFHRYLTTTRYVQKWYEGDVWDVNDGAQRTLSIVRSMHTRVATKMSKRCRRLYISVGYGSESKVFCSTIVLFRSLVGLHGWTNDDNDAILHFWRTIGYLLGIEYKLNLCHGSYNQVVTPCEKLLHKDYKPVVEKVDSISVAMAKNITEAMSMVEPSYTWPALATYIYELVGLPCPVDMCIIDKICYSLIYFMMTYLIKFHRICVNKLTR
ncbi:hypothetical protein AVEN_181434-1 [Araneus ventricosus]|uniref:ER-bound oxygenase mpaB/mpaB'/Rubber oxygenase catalytic domain-containing protein n=1 Tax=Araneus ventricosus TaxID=182803 RepID=A0A4Y2RB29_ARAVE|nr:hypothetical protein AVEN_181434-1 [Araneus ventricosus]